MNTLINLLLLVQMLSAIGMIGLILIQHGKGADMGAAFGSGTSGSLFGATGGANFLSRTTAVLAAVFRFIEPWKIAMRAGLPIAQFFAKAGFEIGGNGVLQLLGFVVDLVPLHAENFRKHAFNQVVALNQTECDLTAFACQCEFAIRVDANQPIATQTANRHGHGRRRHLQASR